MAHFRLLLGLAVFAVAAMLVTLILWAVVPAAYPQSKSIELGGLDGTVWQSAICISGPTKVSFTWGVGTYTHNGSAVAAGYSDRVASLQLWPVGGDSRQPIYNETAAGGSGSYTSQGTEVFQAVGYWGNTAVYIQLSWQAWGHPLTGPTTSAAC